MSASDLALTRDDLPAIKLAGGRVLTGHPSEAWWLDPFHACYSCGMPGEYRLLWGLTHGRAHLMCEWCVEWFAVNDWLDAKEPRADWRCTTR